MPGRSQKASCTVLRVMSSRISVKLRRSLIPLAASRSTVTVTCVLRGPFNRSTTSLVFMPPTGCPLTTTMASPGRMPAAVRGRAGKRRAHHRLVAARSHAHTNAAIVLRLLFAQSLKVLGIEESGVRIEGAQHSRNHAPVDSLIRIGSGGEILFHQLVDARDPAHVLAPPASAAAAATGGPQRAPAREQARIKATGTNYRSPLNHSF